MPLIFSFKNQPVAHRCQGCSNTSSMLRIIKDELKKRINRARLRIAARAIVQTRKKNSSSVTNTHLNDSLIHIRNVHAPRTNPATRNDSLNTHIFLQRGLKNSPSRKKYPRLWWRETLRTQLCATTPPPPSLYLTPTSVCYLGGWCELRCYYESGRVIRDDSRVAEKKGVGGNGVGSIRRNSISPRARKVFFLSCKE